MTRFRPCIDLHAGQVKQIVGGTLSTQESELKTNHVSQYPAAYFAKLYRDANLLGAHVIMLGPGNESAAREALAAWPGHLQVGGGISDANAKEWIEAGAEKVSWFWTVFFRICRSTFPILCVGLQTLKPVGVVGHYNFLFIPQWSFLLGPIKIGACVVGQ